MTANVPSQHSEAQSVSNLPQSEASSGREERKSLQAAVSAARSNALTPQIHFFFFPSPSFFFFSYFKWNLFEMKWRKIKMWPVHGAGLGYNELQVGFEFPGSR